MNSYLKRIAEIFYSEYNTGVANLTFVFPNRRAGLFFQNYLAEQIDVPVFSPAIITINDCFYNASSRCLSERMIELFRLYNLYVKLSKSGESFDSFVFWGEMLLNDFDDVDKYRVDASQLFANITALKELDAGYDFLSDEQRKAIRQFWSHFLPENVNKTQQDYIEIWRILLPLYEEFRAELLADNLSTEGMIYREVIQNLKDGKIPEYFVEKQFVFIGFNALNTCEKELFLYLQTHGQADFYWDYEAPEINDRENQASSFVKENLTLFKSKLTIKNPSVSQKEKSFELLGVPSSIGQTKEVFHILEKLNKNQGVDAKWINTAVVLPDENLLMPLLHSLPERIEHINVTMGYPLKSTPVASLLELIFDLQKRMNALGFFYHQNVSNILNHQYIKTCCPDEVLTLSQHIVQNNIVYVKPDVFADYKLLINIFRPCRDSSDFLDYLLEILVELNHIFIIKAETDNKYRLECDYLHQYYITLNKLRDIQRSYAQILAMNIDTQIRLIRQFVSRISIPFEGAPIEGLQIMGVLETRGLDFDNIILCSFNEGVFPQRSSSGSFIPYGLRTAFQLPTTDSQDKIAAYNFYRLIYRAKQIFLLYDSRTDGTQTGEVSRYARQLKYHYGVDLKESALAFETVVAPESPVVVKKTSGVMSKLYAFTSKMDEGRALSASAVNTYLNCPLQFYFSYVEKLSEEDEVQESIEADMFGRLLHKVLEKVYQPFEGKLVNKQDIDEILSNNLQIDKLITNAFSTEYFKRKTVHTEEIVLEGNQLLIARVIKKYLRQILRRDLERVPFKYIHSEMLLKISLAIFDGEYEVYMKGIIDRVDEKEGVVHVVDYKSGSGSLDFKSLEDVFDSKLDKRPKYVLQTFLYCLLYKDKFKTFHIVPNILYVRDVFKSSFSMSLVNKPVKEAGRAVDDFEDYRNEFIEQLTLCLEEIFNPDIDFTQCDDLKTCAYCPYSVICKRG